MILRIVRGLVAADRLEALYQGFLGSYAPLARRTAGLVRFHAAVRPCDGGHELVVITFWSSLEAAMDAYDGDLSTPRTLDGLATHVVFHDVAHFEVDETQLRRSTAEVEVLRLTFGRVARGADAEIQQQLRSRLHELDPTVTEAYVGRRIVGDDVEITFVSAWETAPSTLSLDQALWPDIAAQYATFAVATYRPIVSGAEA